MHRSMFERMGGAGRFVNSKATILQVRLTGDQRTSFKHRGKFHGTSTGSTKDRDTLTSMFECVGGGWGQGGS